MALATITCVFAACNPTIVTQVVPEGCTPCSEDRQCIDLLRDRKHCGACETKCLEGQVCADGQCGTTCPDEGHVLCDGRCINPDFHPDHCGTCATKCIAPNAAHACSKGACTYGTCAPGFADCDDDMANGCEQRIDADMQNCGGCGVVCVPANTTGASCASGKCSYRACMPTFADCDGNAENGCEIATAFDASHCGGCDIRCSNGNICINGACAAVPPIVGPTSFAYPTDNNGGVTASFSFTLTIQSVTPSIIFYTLDGTTPTYASKYAPSPLELSITNTGNTIVKWFTTIDENVMIHNATIDRSTQYCFGDFVQRVRWDLTGGPVVIASPGQTLNGKVNYQVWRSYDGPSCPSCPGCNRFSGYGVLATEDCYPKSTTPPIWTGETRTDVPITVTAPLQPGLYKLRRSMQLDNECKRGIGVSGDDGTIIVQ